MPLSDHFVGLGMGVRRGDRGDQKRLFHVGQDLARDQVLEPGDGDSQTGQRPNEAKPQVEKAKRNGRERSDESTTTYSRASWIRSKPRQWLLGDGEQA